MSGTQQKYLLILSCSKRKRDVATAPAGELYNGPFYQILRRHRHPNLDILILSARYGLIPASKRISTYDQEMTDRRAQELAKSLPGQLNRAIAQCQYEQILVNLGGTYMQSFSACHDTLDRCNTLYVTGPIGRRLHQLKDWLIQIEEEVMRD